MIKINGELQNLEKLRAEWVKATETVKVLKSEISTVLEKVDSNNVSYSIPYMYKSHSIYYFNVIE